VNPPQDDEDDDDGEDERKSISFARTIARNLSRSPDTASGCVVNASARNLALISDSSAPRRNPNASYASDSVVGGDVVVVVVVVIPTRPNFGRVNGTSTERGGWECAEES
jgi:hypothetical protein